MNTTAPAPLFPHAQWRPYTVFDGLAGMQVEDLHQDRQGFLWIATADGGVSRFDGVHFVNLTCAEGLPHPTVMSIAETDDGRLWFGTMGGGLAAYDGHRFDVFTTAHGLPSDVVMRLHPRPDGSLLVGTRNGVAVFVQDRCQEVATGIDGRPFGWVYDCLTDRAGTTWMATNDLGVVSLDGRCLLSPEGKSREEFVWPWHLAEDAAGALWVAPMYVASDVHLYRCNPATGTVERVRVADGSLGRLVKHGVLHVRTDDAGWVWATHRGAMAFDGSCWRTLEIPLDSSSLSDTKLTYQDREGNLWLGFWGGGVAFCDPHSVRRFTRADGLPDDEVTCLAEDRQGRVWIGTMGGMARLEEDRVVPPPTDGWPACMARQMIVDRLGRVWWGGHQAKVHCWDGRALRAIEVGGNEGITRVPFP
ncbi:MAG: two-component regulator propeller domain-containing protein, partial [Candidatus Latescibacterota bacterium]